MCQGCSPAMTEQSYKNIHWCGKCVYIMNYFHLSVATGCWREAGGRLDMSTGFIMSYMNHCLLSADIHSLSLCYTHMLHLLVGNHPGFIKHHLIICQSKSSLSHLSFPRLQFLVPSTFLSAKTFGVATNLSSFQVFYAQQSWFYDNLQLQVAGCSVCHGPLLKMYNYFDYGVWVQLLTRCCDGPWKKNWCFSMNDNTEPHNSTDSLRRVSFTFLIYLFQWFSIDYIISMYMRKQITEKKSRTS